MKLSKGGLGRDRGVDRKMVRRDTNEIAGDVGSVERVEDARTKSRKTVRHGRGWDKA